MAKRKMYDKLIHKTDIVEELVPIKYSNVDYITISGKVYCDYGNDNFYLKRNFVNKSNGYVYVSIKHKSGNQVQKRIHRLLAETFIPNPNNYDIVMHIDNNKQNNNITNLKWGNISMNTKQAFDDGLLVNAKSFEDSQSMPVAQFNLQKQLITVFGSICEAERCTGITKTAISGQCRHKTIAKHKKPRSGYYFRFLSEFDKFGFVL